MASILHLVIQGYRKKPPGVSNWGLYRNGAEISCSDFSGWFCSVKFSWRVYGFAVGASTRLLSAGVFTAHTHRTLRVGFSGPRF